MKIIEIITENEKFCDKLLIINQSKNRSFPYRLSIILIFGLRLINWNVVWLGSLGFFKKVNPHQSRFSNRFSNLILLPLYCFETNLGQFSANWTLVHFVYVLDFSINDTTKKKTGKNGFESNSWIIRLNKHTYKFILWSKKLYALDTFLKFEFFQIVKMKSD